MDRVEIYYIDEEVGQVVEFEPDTGTFYYADEVDKHIAELEELAEGRQRSIIALQAENERLLVECGQGYHEGVARATEESKQMILYLEDHIAKLEQDLADMDAENTRLLHDRDTAFDEGMEAAAEYVGIRILQQERRR